MLLCAGGGGIGMAVNFYFIFSNTMRLHREIMPNTVCGVGCSCQNCFQVTCSAIPQTKLNCGLTVKIIKLFTTGTDRYLKVTLFLSWKSWQQSSFVVSALNVEDRASDYHRQKLEKRVRFLIRISVDHRVPSFCGDLEFPERVLLYS